MTKIRGGYRVEILGLGEIEQPSVKVRVRLVDSDTGQTIAQKEMPFSWLRDAGFAHGICTVVMKEGDWA